MTTARTGGRILVDQLVVHGAKLVFCVPGESYLAALDALYDTPPIRLIAGRMEASCANMACAHGQLTGRPGIFFASRGPGAAQASVAVHTAKQGSVPLIMFVGQVPRAHRDREAFQEVDIDAMFAPLAKWTATIDAPARIPEYVSRAYRVATAGRPGPVVLTLPEDVLTETADAPDAPDVVDERPARPAPAATQLARVRELVGRAERPLVVAGGGGWSERAATDTVALCESWGVPLATAFRCQDYVDNGSPAYCGTLGLGIDPRLGARVRESDLLLVIGARLDEPTTGGYSIIEAPRPRQALIHVHADPDELGHVFEPTLGICAGSAEFVAAAAALEAPDGTRWQRWTAAAAADARAFRMPGEAVGGIDLARAVSGICDALGPEAIVTNGAGNYTLWVHRFWQFARFGAQLAPVSGSMGYGLPAAIAAKLAEPARSVVSFNGDGCFMMGCQELATAVRHQANVVFVVIDNSSYGTIRMHQERRYPGRPVGTALVNPDFVAFARSFGLRACSVTSADELIAAVVDGVSADHPSLVHVPLSPERLTPPRPDPPHDGAAA
jgi:acetolactate synthase I/II/III large subunit